MRFHHLFPRYHSRSHVHYCRTVARVQVDIKVRRWETYAAEKMRTGRQTDRPCYFIIESAEALSILCVRCARWGRERERDRERERERERERRKWRHYCRAKISDEFTLPLAENSHNWRWVYTFPCQKFALFVSIVALKFAMSSHFLLPKKFAAFVSTLWNGASRATSDRKPKTNDQTCPVKIVLPIEKCEAN